jgi:hypothetical protein
MFWWDSGRPTLQRRACDVFWLKRVRLGGGRGFGTWLSRRSARPEAKTLPLAKIVLAGYKFLTI